MRQRITAAVFAALVVLAGMVAVVPAASAATGPVFAVMNTSEAPPDGVYFRNSPHTADTSRITGLGVYAGERIQASCYSMGDAVGSYGNKVWYYSYNVSRPTAAGRTNVGWLNTHYVNDGQSANHAAPGVPVCGSAPAPPIHAVYYSPSAGEASAPGATNVAVSAWSNPSVSCDTSRAIDYTNSATTTLAGWSKGRMGPIYALGRASTAQLKQINYVLLIDPASYDEIASSCDGQKLMFSSADFETAGQVFAKWLTTNPAAQLVVLAGDVTADASHPVNGYGHAGIQNFYFNEIRAAGSSARSRTLVCNYGASHTTMYNSSAQYIQQPALTSCPSLAGTTQGAAWHP